MGSVNGRVVLITGGGNGIGAALGRRLHAKGAKVVLTDLDESALHDVASDLNGDRVLTLTADVRDLASMQEAASRAIDRFGGIDVVVANAGIGIYGSVLKVDPWLSKPSSMSIWSVSSIPCARLCHRSSSGAATCSSCRRLRLISPARAWRHTTPPRRATSTSQARFVRRSLISASTSAQKCADVFVKGIEGRKRRVNCPGWVGVFRWLKPLLTTSAGESQLAKTVPELLPRMDAEIAALGRSMSARTEALEKRTTR